MTNPAAFIDKCQGCGGWATRAEETLTVTARAETTPHGFPTGRIEEIVQFLCPACMERNGLGRKR